MRRAPRTGPGKLLATVLCDAPVLDARSGRLTVAQADRQRGGVNLADGVVVVLRGPAQQFESDRIVNRALIQKLQRALELKLRHGGFGHDANQNADQTLTAEGDQDPHAKKGRLLRPTRGRAVIKHLAQRRVDGDLQNHRIFVHRSCG